MPRKTRSSWGPSCMNRSSNTTIQNYLDLSAFVAFPCPRSPSPHLPSTSSKSTTSSTSTSAAHTDSKMDELPPLVKLPAELLHQILSYLSAADLAQVSATCRSLAEHAANELLWADLLNAYLPVKLQYPSPPFESFRELYAAYHPCWFVPQHKIWFSDTEHTGNLILARYDPRRGVIEAYRVIAERRSRPFQVWESNPDVMVQPFDPKVSLWLDDPVLLLKKNHGRLPRYLHSETRMPMAIETQHVFNAFSLCSLSPPNLPVDPEKQWPPPTIPSEHRVYRDMEWDQHPRRLANMSEHAFRIRRWAHFRLGMPMFTAGRSETLSTYATLDPRLYTPTREKPYQGIWVGDYSAHGCEFLLFLQRGRDEEPFSTADEPFNPSDEPSGPSDEPELGPDEIIQKGSLEGIKLTGDPNVPRGQISFVAPDIGPGGVVRVAEEALFRGSRIVRSKGHVAGLGFRDDTFIPAQLILISTDCVALYWEAMGHMSYFKRFDIDALIHT